MTTKKKILAAVQLPPPIHGASLRNREFTQSEFISNAVDLIVFPIQTASDIEDIGKFSYRKALYVVKMLLFFVVEVLKEKPDILYVTLSSGGIGFFKDSLLMLLARPFVKRRYVHCRNLGLTTTSENPAFRLLGRMALANAEAFVLSESLVHDVECYFSPQCIHVVHNCIDDSDFDRATKVEDKYEVLKRYIPSARGEILDKKSDFTWFYHIANLSEEKGSLDVLKAFLKLDADVASRSRLVVIGGWSGKDEAAAYKLIESSPKFKNFIYLTGHLDGVDKFVLINMMDVHVFPTKYKRECFPGVILEAMCCSKPSISTCHAAVPDIIKNGKDGYILEKGAIDDLAACMKMFVENASLSINLGVNARKKYEERFTRKAVYTKILDGMNVPIP